MTAAASSEEAKTGLQGTQAIRTRFAPSPTGSLHVGGARTALYNWLLAKQKNGTFVVRVEDTDVARSTRESEQSVLRDLRWLGLEWAEGPEAGGESGPYRQSERSDIYKEYAQRLLAEGKAYPCFCTEEELEAKRQQAEREGRPPQYDGTWRDADPAEVQRRIDAGETYTVRFKVPDGKRVTIEDAVRGKVSWDANATVGDFILLRSTGVPVYNFCVAVDDALMNVSTVIRAEEHLTNTLRQILILEALGFEAPLYAHCSLILGEDRNKLSKRHGATSVDQFRLEGYLPEAMVNYLALLGWNDGTEKEIYTVDELVEAFDIGRVTKSPAVFDVTKLRWINGQHLRALPPAELTSALLEQWHRAGVFDSSVTKDQPMAEHAAELIRGGLELASDGVSDLQKVLDYPMNDTIDSGEAEELLVEGGGFLEIVRIILRDYDAGEFPLGTEGDEHTAAWKKWVKATGKETKRKGKKLFHPIRLALTGRMSGPDVGDVVQLLHYAESTTPGSFVSLTDRIQHLRERVANE